MDIDFSYAGGKAGVICHPRFVYPGNMEKIRPGRRP
jgi:hypothetical protein